MENRDPGAPIESLVMVNWNPLAGNLAMNGRADPARGSSAPAAWVAMTSIGARQLDETQPWQLRRIRWVPGIAPTH
jgi:hypothetical protein